MMKTQLTDLFSTLGLLVIMVALSLPLCHVGFVTLRWVYTAGAAVYLLAQLFKAGEGKDESLRVRRLLRLRLWSAVFFAVAVAMMFLRNVGATDWVAFTLAGAALIVYVNLMLPRARRSQGE